jgi:hypothetical protein
MRRHVATALLCALSLLATAACSSDPGGDHKDAATAPVPLAGASAQRSATPTVEREIRSGDDMPHVATYVAAGQQVQMNKATGTRLPLHEDAAALITGFDENHNVVARAITAEVDGLKDKPVVVDYTSTALTRLLTTPPYLTSDPVSLIVLAGVAQDSPHLEALADAMRANAQTRPDWEQHPSPAEVAEYAALARDVSAALAEAAADLRAPAKARPAALLGMQPQLSSCLASADRGDETRVCLKVKTSKGVPAVDKRGLLHLTAENTGGSWAAVLDQGGALTGVSTPRVTTVPGLTAVIEALVKAGARVGVAGLAKPADWACKGAGRLGLSFGLVDDACDKVTELADVQKAIGDAFDGLVEDLAPVSYGAGKVYLTREQAQHELFVFTAGTDGSSPAVRPAGNDVVQSLTETSLVLLTSYTQVMKPLIELVSGTKADPDETSDTDQVESDGVDGYADEDGETNSAEGRTHGAGVAPKSVQARTFDAVLEAVKGSDELVPLANAVLSAINNGETTDALVALAKLTYGVIKDPSVWAAMLTGVEVSDLVVAGITNLIEKFGEAAIPGPGWVKAAIDATDTAANALNVAFGAWAVTDALFDTKATGSFAAPAPADDQILRSVDWANYSGYHIDDEAFALDDGYAEVANSYSMETTAVSLVGSLVGNWHGKPTALVVLSSQYICDSAAVLHLFQVKNGRPTWVGWARDPAPDTVWAYGWSFEDGKLLNRYNTVSRAWQATLELSTLAETSAYLPSGVKDIVSSEYDNPPANAPSQLKWSNDSSCGPATDW